jgi:phage gp36-like protein
MLEKKIRRYKLMDAHRDLTRRGKYGQAKLVLRLLKNGKVRLGLDDDSCAVEIICEGLGCRINYGRGYYSATAII